MARAKNPTKPPKVKAITIVAVKPKVHGKSLEANPDRTPHPTAPGRDIGGRIMKASAIPGAAPPFTAATRPIPTPPVSVPPPPQVNPAGLGNMPNGPVNIGIPPALGRRR
jgi:hypothetical protein